MATDETAPLQSANLRAASYYVVRTCAACPHCGVATLLSALGVPPGHETRDEESEAWQPVRANAIAFYVANVSAAVHRRLCSEAPNWRFAQSEITGNAYWANHCAHCSSLIGDEALHGEPGVHGFIPCSQADAANITLVEMREPFEALAAGYATEPEFFSFMRRA